MNKEKYNKDINRLEIIIGVMTFLKLVLYSATLVLLIVSILILKEWLLSLCFGVFTATAFTEIYKDMRKGDKE